MTCLNGLGKGCAEAHLANGEVSRRDFMKFCTAVAAVMGMEASFAPRVAEALTRKKRPSVVYLHNAECTGCSEAILRTVAPYIDDLILNTISLDYHETLMAAAGHAAEEALEQAVSNPEGYICVIEGAIPTKDGGIYGKIAVWEIESRQSSSIPIRCAWTLCNGQSNTDCRNSPSRFDQIRLFCPHGQRFLCIPGTNANYWKRRCNPWHNPM